MLIEIKYLYFKLFISQIQIWFTSELELQILELFFGFQRIFFSSPLPPVGALHFSPWDDEKDSLDESSNFEKETENDKD
jgi:hypothetical protein